MGIHITGFTYIPTEEEREPIDKEKLKDLFSDGVPKIAHENTNNRKNPVKEITPKNMSKLESIDIKDNSWEQVKPSQKWSHTEDMKSIRPARSDSETNDGGAGIVPGLKDTIMANLFEKPKNSEFSNHAIAAGKERREQKANRGKPTQEARDQWEKVSEAPTTENTKITDRGVVPNRSALEPGELPKVKISTVEKIKEKNKESFKRGVEAAELKREIDQIMMEKQNKISNNWEEEAYGKLKEATELKVENGFEKIEFSKPQVTCNPINSEKNKDLNLNGLFSMPEDPNSVPEKSLSRDSSKLKTQRKNREDDRSWETVVRSSNMNKR